MKLSGEFSEIKYAKNGAYHLAYQTIGQGEQDILFIPGWVSNLEETWKIPEYAAWLYMLTTFGRLIMFDKRGTGLSDRVSEDQLPDLESRADDIACILKSENITRCVLLGISEGVPMSILLTARYPHLVSKMILYAGFACFTKQEKYPWVRSLEEHHQRLELIVSTWGKASTLTELAPSVAGDPRIYQQVSAFLRASASPGAAAALYKMNMSIDVRSWLPQIKIETLILHRLGDRLIKYENSEYLHRNIAGSTLHLLKGDDHLPFFGETRSVLNAILTFMEKEKSKTTILYSPVEIETIFRIKLYLEQNYALPLTLGGLSRSFGLNLFKLKHLFKEVTGFPVIQYLQRVRLNEASVLLADQSLQVDQIASLVGYQYTNNFSTAFKKWFGCTPTQYRQKPLIVTLRN